MAADCNSEQAAARALGYTQASWDNQSGQEIQPDSADKNWADLTASERAAAADLGFTQTSWDNESGSEPQPASEDKYYAQLTDCGAQSFIACVLLSPV